MVFHKISIIILALAGLAIIFYMFLKRKRKEGDEKPYEPKKDDPIKHIKEKLFLEVPIEKIVIGFFSITILIYVFKLIIGELIPELDLTILYLSSITFLLMFYKLTMVWGTLGRFNPWLFFSIIFSGLIFFMSYSGLEVDIFKLLHETREYNLAIHLIGVVLGLGGTMIIDIMFTHFLKNYHITARESVIMHLISQMIILGLILLIVSGIALFLPLWGDFLASSRFLMKMVVVLVVIINGAALNFYVTPKMKKISLKEEDQGSYETLKRVSFALGALSIISWFSAFLLAMLKALFTMPFLHLFIGYLILISLGVGASQLAKVYYEKKEAGEI
jgi:hypothetical protein